MKTQPLFGLLAVFVVGAGSGPRLLPAAETPAAPERIGIYDSRAVAYAHFWSEAHQRDLNDLAKKAKEAKAAGQTGLFTELEAALKKASDGHHLRVFSTAPVDDVLAGMKERVAEIMKQAGVTRCVSKWDEAVLKGYPATARVDVTDLLLREFKLTDKQMKGVQELRTKPPLPLDRAQRQVREGKL